MSFNSYPLLKDDDSNGELISELKFDYDDFSVKKIIYDDYTLNRQKLLKSFYNLIQIEPKESKKRTPKW